jgi:hypothetical protein
MKGQEGAWEGTTAGFLDESQSTQFRWPALTRAATRRTEDPRARPCSITHGIWLIGHVAVERWISSRRACSPSHFRHCFHARDALWFCGLPCDQKTGQALSVCTGRSGSTWRNPYLHEQVNMTWRPEMHAGIGCLPVVSKPASCFGMQTRGGFGASRASERVATTTMRGAASARGYRLGKRVSGVPGRQAKGSPLHFPASLPRSRDSLSPREVCPRTEVWRSQIRSPSRVRNN